MQKINKSIFINAPREKVWDIVFGDKTYRDWTSAFGPEGHFEGDWSEGSKMKFVGPDPETGKEMGMVSRIAENRNHEFMSIEHLGITNDGVEDTSSEEAKKWSVAFENYIFNEKDGGTELVIDQDITDEYKEMFDGLWDKALQRVKELSE